MANIPEAPIPTEEEYQLQRRRVPDNAGVSVRSGLPAWLVSLLFHVVVLTSVAVLWKTTPKGTGAERGGPVGIAVVFESTTGEQYSLSDGSSDTDASTEAAAAALPDANSIGEANSQSLADLLPTGLGAGSETAAAAGSMGMENGGGEIGGSRKGTEVKTSVFGIEGTGTRFVYVFDRSDSMNGYGGKPLASAKRELLGSLESLTETHQFQIIFYNDSPLPYGGMGLGGPRLMRGSAQSKRLATRFVRDIGAVGGTQHIAALKMGLAMGPDVIFFLTDADFPAPSQGDLERIQRDCERSGTTIHCIQFGDGINQSGGGWIRRMAEKLGGEYRYVDVAEF